MVKNEKIHAVKLNNNYNDKYYWLLKWHCIPKIKEIALRKRKSKNETQISIAYFLRNYKTIEYHTLKGAQDHDRV